MMVDFVRAIKRPFTDIKKMMVGILFYLPIPFISFITNLIATGYALNCGRAASNSDYKMPEWKDYWRLWIDGLVAGIISLIYMIPFGLFIVIYARGLLMDFMSGGTTFLGSFISNPFSFISVYGNAVLLLLALMLIISYFIPIAVLNWIITGKFGSAFDLDDIFKKVFTGIYFITWLVIIIISSIIAFITAKYLPMETASDISLFVKGTNLAKLSIYFVGTAVVQFIQMVFIYTVYGNVLAELKK